jgi:hypothetical protein
MTTLLAVILLVVSAASAATTEHYQIEREDTIETVAAELGMIPEDFANAFPDTKLAGRQVLTYDLASAETYASEPAPETTPAPISAQWGAFTGTQSLPEFERRIGYPVDIRATFIGENDTFQCNPGKQTLVYWENRSSLNSIINGDLDTKLRALADKSDSCPGTIIAPFHEMNGNWTPWGGAHNSKETIIEAFRHVASILKPHARIAWVVNNVSIPNEPSNSHFTYWPGADYVDIVGVDGFNYSGQTQFSEMFPDELLATLKAPGLPVVIASLGLEGDQSTLFKTFFAGFKDSGLNAFVYFNYADGGSWPISDSGLNAFRSGLNSLGL